MASTKLQNTFLSVYKDDFRDSDNYHRILFNSGRALQARELTQSQTIIQKEIERFARYIFKEGALITSSMGNLATKELAVDFVKLDTSVNQLPADYASLVNTTVTNSGAIASPVSARIRAVVPAEGSDPATLLIEYIDGGSNNPINITTPQIFRAGQNLTTTLGTLTVQSADTTENPATGKGSIITTPSTEFFVLGHFVFVPSQTLVISKYDRFPTDVIGYTVAEQIVTVNDELALYDNQGSTPNLTSPGADRYRIRLTLAKESNTSVTDTFIPVIKVSFGNVEIVNNADNALNRIGDTIAKRTYEESGNYIVNAKNRFQLQFVDTYNPNYFAVSIKPGVAYLNGRRVEKPLSTNDLRVYKPRNAVADISNVSNMNVAADYGSYLLADSMYGLVSDLVIISDNAKNDSTINLYNGTNIGGTVIGSARIRSLDKVENNYRLHIFDLAMDSNGSGQIYSFGNVRSVGNDSANYANIVLDDNKAKIYNTVNNSLLFSLPKERPYSLETITMDVSEVFTSTTDGAGAISFTTSRSEDLFTNEEDWLLAYDSDGEVLTVPQVTKTSGGSGTTAVAFSGLQANKAVRLLSYVRITGNVKAKTLVENETESSVTVTNSKFTLSKTDIYKIKAVVDNTTNEIITYKFTFDLGQRDNYYTVGSGTLKPGQLAPAGTIKVIYDYFQHGAGDFFSVNSYGNLSYDKIPTYRQRNGSIVNLRDVIDLRPTKDTAGSNFTSTGSDILRIPKNRGLINISTGAFWNYRVDVVYLDTDEQIRLKKGKSSAKIEYPTIPPGALPLHYLILRPFTITKNDIQVITPKNLGYTMSQIRRLDERISRLEEATTLTLAELDTNNITVVDENGNIRTKLGLTADGFVDHSQSASIGNIGYRAALDRLEGSLRPMQIRRQLPLYYDSDASVGVKRYGDTLWPLFEEVVYINQNIASGPIDVNQFTLPKFIGSLTLYPDADTWVERRTTSRNGDTTVIRDGDLSTYDKFVNYNR